MPHALPCDAGVRRWHPIIRMRGVSGSASPRIIVRPITLVSMPTPLMSFPIWSTSSTSRSSIGRRGRWARASASRSGSTTGICAAGTTSTAMTCSSAFSTMATPSTTLPCASTCAPISGHERAQPRRAVRVDALRLHAVAEADRDHLHETALVRAVEVGVGLHPVHDDRGRRLRRLRVGHDLHPADLGGQLDHIHARAHRASEVLLVEPVRRQHLALALGGCAAVASHRRHHEGLGALARAPSR